MPAIAEAPEFTPPPEGSLLRSLAFAIVAHLVLVMGLSIGVQWKREDDKIAVEAELWAPTPQQAAPKAVEAPPPPPPPPPLEKPVVQPPPPPAKSEADIALERERQAAEEARKREEEAERQRKLAADRKRQQELEQQQAKKAAEDRRREEVAKAKRDAELAKARREKQDDERLAKLREENLKRIQGMAGATGGPSSGGTAMQSAGPSASYGGRVRARVRPNIVFTDFVSGNPSAEVDVRLAPDGTVIGKSLRKSSGVASWDEAVLRAIDRTEVFPRDIDGRVPSAMTLVFRPKD